MRLGLFITCLGDGFSPRSGIAIVRILEHLGHEVDFPLDQTCCGQPLYNGGYGDQARDLVRRFAAQFESFDAVVTPSGSCAAMIREHGPALFADETERTRIEAVTSKTYEFVELLVRVLEVDLAALGVRWDGDATYHPACHGRALRLHGLTENAIRSIPGLDYRPLEGQDRCCGFGGTFSIAYPSVSGMMVRDKVEAVRATGAGTLLCNDAGCAMNIAGACHREKCDVVVRSLAEVIADGLGLMGDDPA